MHHGQSNWLIWNEAPSTIANNPWGRQIICQAEYVQGKADGTCPESFVPITTNSAACLTAGEYLGFSGPVTNLDSDDADDSDEVNNPTGCFHSNGDLFYNSNSGAFTAENNKFIICRKTYAVRLLAVDLMFTTSIIYNDVSYFIET
eukprot:UN25731